MGIVLGWGVGGTIYIFIFCRAIKQNDKYDDNDEIHTIYLLLKVTT